MPPNTRFTDLVGCTLPIQLAAMGFVGTAELAAGVIAAGGLGMVPHGVQPAVGACGVNFLVPFAPSLVDIEEQASTATVIEFFFGAPRRDLVAAAHAGGALVGWQTGSAEEAEAAELAGCDYVAVQGIEAGGHVRGHQSLDEVLASARDTVRLPLLAAGGIATARRVAAVMTAGADGVRVGTRFVTCPEANAHPAYVARLLEATGDDTVVTGGSTTAGRTLRTASSGRPSSPPSRAAGERRCRRVGTSIAIRATWRCTRASASATSWHQHRRLWSSPISSATSPRVWTVGRDGRGRDV